MCVFVRVCVRGEIGVLRVFRCLTSWCNEGLHGDLEDALNILGAEVLVAGGVSGLVCSAKGELAVASPRSCAEPLAVVIRRRFKAARGADVCRRCHGFTRRTAHARLHRAGRFRIVSIRSPSLQERLTDEPDATGHAKVIEAAIDAALQV